MDENPLKGKPVTDDEKARIIELARTGMSRNEVAKTVGRSNHVVTKTCADAGVAFDRAGTIEATAARQIDNAAKRAELVTEAYAKSGDVLAMIDQTTTVTQLSKDGVWVDKELAKPTFADQRNIAITAKVLADMARMLEVVDGDGRIDEAKSLLGALEHGIKAAAEHLGL
jgi:transposase